MDDKEAFSATPKIKQLPSHTTVEPEPRLIILRSHPSLRIQ